MPPRLRFVLALLLLVGCDSGGELAPEEAITPTAPQEVSYLTEDGKNITGTWQAAEGVEHGPGVLLLHQVDAVESEGHDRHDWDTLFPMFLEAGVSVLAIDFRSHGASDPADVPVFDLGSDREQLRYDVEGGIDFLEDQHPAVLPGHTGVVGLGLGGSIAVVANHYSGEGLSGDWGARAVVAVSARSDRASDLTEAGDQSLSLTNGFFLAAADHELDAPSAEALHSMTEEERRLELVSGSSAHGSALLVEQPHLAAEVVAWIAARLTPSSL